MEYFIKASAVLGIFYICYKLFLQRETFFNANRWFLLTGIVVAIFLPLLVIPLYVDYNPISIPSNLLSANQIQDESKITAFSLLQIISWIYLVGILLFSGKLLLEFTSLFSLIKNDSHKKETGFTFIETKNNVPPFSFFKWIVYNPNQFQKEELTHVLNHEKAHARQYHSIDVLLAQLTCVIFWFNPFCWLYKKELQQNLEFIADNQAQDISTCEQSYQRLLLKTSIPNHPLVITNNFYNSLTRLTLFGKKLIIGKPFGQVKKRIVMLHKSKSNKLNAWKFGIILPLLALFLMSFSTKEVLIETSSVNNSLQNSTNQGTLLITKDFTDTELGKIKSQLLQEGFTIKIKSIKRNVSDEIIAIKIDVASKETTTNYHVKTDLPISPIIISFNKDGSHIYIGSTSTESENQTVSLITKNGHTTKLESKDPEETIYFLSNNDSTDLEVIVEDANGNLIKTGEKLIISTSESNSLNSNISSNNEPETKHIKITKKVKDGKLVKQEIIIEDGKTFLLQSDDVTSNNQNPTSFKLREDEITLKSIDKESPIFILDGKEITNEEMKQVTPDLIASVNILKGDTAVKKYGEKGKNGVIEITTKK
ncbi:M56 family metallopeptidase [Bizionia arctica]|uniref:Peptidase M56 domain-containing protein n=1 Tax=Bizionia arctica TaxID=1495645 RepID=A0A917GSC9_9FLAO|nr:M56 family metallopeptidase [Bizionia arctica]GGG55546.1 hypothetical protein GCM10010976_28020 [Bizionia arctica]